MFLLIRYKISLILSYIPLDGFDLNSEACQIMTDLEQLHIHPLGKDTELIFLYNKIM